MHFRFCLAPLEGLILQYKFEMAQRKQYLFALLMCESLCPSSSLAFHWYFDDLCGLKCKADTIFELAFHWGYAKGMTYIGMTSWKLGLHGPKGSDQS